jgi:tetratricopeptide (TPR) repeat protein
VTGESTHLSSIGHFPPWPICRRHREARAHEHDVSFGAMNPLRRSAFLIRSRRPSSVVADVACGIGDFAHERFAEGRGGTVFLSGGPGAGHDLIFDELPCYVSRRRQPALLLRGSIVNGIYIPVALRVTPTSTVLAAAADVTGWLAPLMGPLGPLSPLLGQIISSVNDGRRLYRTLSASRTSALTGPRLLQRALRAVADEHPLCLAIESTAADASWWTDLVENLSIEADVDLRILTIVGLDGPSQLSTNGDSDSDLSRLATNLVNSGRARWWSMPTLDDAAVVSLIGSASVDVSGALATLADGQVGRLVQLFDGWRREHVVARDRRGMWVFDHAELQRGVAPAKDIVDDRIREASGHNRRSFDEARRFLVMAALQGESFVLAPIAELLGTPLDACARLAGRLTREDGCKPLLEAVQEIPAGPVHQTPRYRFTDRWIWYSLERYGLSKADEPEAAMKCARSLEQIYAAEPASIAYVLERLYRLAHDLVERERWRRIAEVAPAEDQIRWQAKVVIEDERLWSTWTGDEARRTADFLLRASTQLSRMRPRHELWPLLEAAEKIASIHDLPQENAKALRLQGNLYAADGNYVRARERLDTAERIQRPLDTTSEHADLLCDLAYVESVEGEAHPALARLDHAIAACKAPPGSTRVEARARELCGKIALECGDARAKGDLAAAVRLFRELDDMDGVTSSLTALGSAQAVERDIPGAVDSLSEAIAVAHRTGNKAAELAAQQYVGALISDDEMAYRHHQRALTLARELNYAPAEAESLLSLACSARALGRIDEAAHLLQQAFDLERRLKDAVGVAWCRLEMGALQISVGTLTQATKNLKAAQEVFSARNIREGLGLTHHALGNVAAIRGDRRTTKRELELAASCGVGGQNRMLIIQPQRRPRSNSRL